ncbi:MAG: ABC transporter ATP-binding protein [Planctomycetes bacterium]|nr:ABC transporter ATP-binding protein [Planctomycetota bacterium]
MSDFDPEPRSDWRPMGDVQLETSPAEVLIQARGIRRSYKVGERTLEILHGVDLELHQGERLCLMGASGTGKTTLLNILGLLDKPTQGSVSIMGQDGWNRSTAKRAELRNESIGYVFQFYHLFAELSALENALLPAMLKHGFWEYQARKRQYRERALDLLERFGLKERLKHRPGKLSGGEQQRVAIARALLLDPPILIADEPTGNLDRATGETVLQLLFQEQEKRNLGLLLVTHDESLATRCDRVLHMEDGLILPPESSQH